MRQSFQRAFTLLEIMISMAIFSVVIIAIYASWASIVRGAKLGQDAAAAAQRSRIAIRTIEDALLTTQLYLENLPHYSFDPVTTDPKFAWLGLTAQLPSTFPGSGLYGDQTVRRVTFSVEADSDGTKQLLMTQIPILIVTNSDVIPYPVTLVRDVSLFVLEFWDVRLGDWTDEWLTTNQLPRMMRVSIGTGEKNPEIISRVIALPATAVPADVQRPGATP